MNPERQTGVRDLGCRDEELRTAGRGSEPVGLRTISPAAFSRRDAVGSVPLNYPGSR